MLAINPFMFTLQFINSVHQMRSKVWAQFQEQMRALQVSDLELQIL